MKRLCNSTYVGFRKVDYLDYIAHNNNCMSTFVFTQKTEPRLAEQATEKPKDETLFLTLEKVISSFKGR